MDALMDRSRDNQICHSMDDFQAQVGGFVASRCSPTRAEHVSMSLELRPQTIFHLTADSESGNPDSGDPTEIQNQQVVRTVAASETVTNQSSDDPALQQSVAKHIIGKLVLVDGSTWTIREATRGTQGWTFFYLCTGSMEAWTRANAKRSDRPVIAGYSSGPGSYDPINIARPGFDCRGTLSIAFSGTNRAIIVKYEHTPLHRTVSQLLDLIAPTVPPPPVILTPNNFRANKAKRPRPAEGEEGSGRKKRSKKQKIAEAPARDADAPTSGDITPAIENQDSASAQDSNATSNPHPGVPPEISQLATALNIPPAEAERRRNTAVSLLSSKGIDPSTLSTEQMNIFANQAPQLQEASLEMLAKYGAERLRIVHPDSKGPENSPSSTQSTPQYQQNPMGDGQASTRNSTPNPQSTETPSKKRRNKKKAAVSDGSTELSIGDGAVVAVGQNGTVGTTTSSLKPATAKARKTRGACDTCKQRKAKLSCTKEHPECTVCQQEGLQCVYSAPKPRVRKSELSAAIVQDDGNESQQADPEPQEQFNHHMYQSAPAPVPEPPAPVAAPEPDPEPETDPDQEAESDAEVEAEPEPSHQVPGPAMHMSHSATAHDPDNDEFIPDPNILSGPVDDAPALPQQIMHNYHQPPAAGLTFPQLPQANPAPSHTNTNMPALTFSPTATQNNQGHVSQGLTLPPTGNQQPQVHHTATMSNAQPSSSSTNAQHRNNNSQSSGRHSLPSAAQTKSNQAVPAQTQARAPQWNAAAAAPAPSRSPATQHSAPRRPVSRKSAGAKAQKQARDSMHQAAAALTQAASQARTQQISATGKSPLQTAARTKSRQGHRSQSNTPVTNASISRPPPQQTPVPPPVVNTTSNYDPYGRYNPPSNQTPSVAADNSSSRVTYENKPYGSNSQSNTASDPYTVTPTYDYTRDTGTSNPLAQALNPNTGYGASNNASNQWGSTQSRNPPPTAPNPYMTGSTSNSSQGYENRANNRPSTQTPMYSQAPQQSYPSYAPQTTASHTQQPQQQQQQQQQPSWYGMSTSSNSNQPSYNSRNNGYGSMQPLTHSGGFQGQRNMAYGSHGYGNSDDQSIYELLRTGNPSH